MELAKRSKRSSGLRLDAGKCAASAASPAAESLVAGVPDAKPPTANQARPADSNAKRAAPIGRTTSGRCTMRAATRPQPPTISWPGLGRAGQKATLPKIASSAGSRVSAAPSMTATPSASDGPRPRYSAKEASARQVKAAMTVSAEYVIDAPTRVMARTRASEEVPPRRISSRTRKTRKSP